MFPSPSFARVVVLLVASLVAAACAPAAPAPTPAPAKPPAEKAAPPPKAAEKPEAKAAPSPATLAQRLDLSRVPADQAAFTVGFIQGLLDIPVRTMQKLDLPKKYALNVEFKQFGDPDTINDAFMLKQITFQPGANVLITGNRKIQTGYSLAVFPTFKASNKLVVKTGSPYNSLADLRGKRIAVQSTTGGEFLVLKWLFKTDHGMDLLKDVDPRGVPPPVAQQLFDQGEVEAVLLFEPFSSRSQFGGKGRVLTDIQQEWQKRKGQPLWFSAIHVDDVFAREHPNAVKRYLMAYTEAVDYINKNHVESFQGYRQAFNITDEADFQLILKAHEGVYSADWNDQVVGSLREFMKLAVEEGQLPRVVEDLFSKDFAP